MTQLTTIRHIVKIRNETRNFAFSLDPEKPSHQLIIDRINDGQLYEPEVALFFCQVLKPGDVVIDSGGGVVYFSVLASTLVGPSGRVITFEPDSVNRERIAMHLAMNSSTNISVEFCALYSENTELVFHINGDSHGGHALWDIGQHPRNQKARESPQTCTVPARTLSSELQRLDVTKARIIKLDIEGAEVHALTGAADFLAQYQVPYIIVEIYDFALMQMGRSREELFSLMKNYGYSPYSLDEGGGMATPFQPDGKHSFDVFNVMFMQD